MTTNNDPTAQALERLGARTPEVVAELFAEARQRFDEEAIVHSSDRESLQAFVLRWTGRKAGILTQITNNWLKTAPPELKPAVGQELNKFKAHIESVIAERQRAMEAASEQTAAERDKIDLSLPGIERAFGTRHLIRQTFEELQRIFTAIGFSVVQGPEIETPYYNFEALNIPEHHPARDNMDTFYIEGAQSSHLLRTHTSPMQIRTMEKEKPPVRIVVRGKVYRRDILTRRTATCSTRLKASRWTPTSPSAISKAPWSISRANFWGRKRRRACGRVIFRLPSLPPKWTRPVTCAAEKAAAFANFPAGSNCSARAW